MKRTIRISEQDLVRLIRKTINEDKEGDGLKKVVTGFLSSIFGDMKKDTSSGSNTSNTSTSSVSSNFEEQINKIVDNFEGGYYNPSTMRTSGMGNSGETMMGMDRKHGVDFVKTPAGQEFWKLIDDANAKENWKYNYKGGPLENKLRNLVSQMIKPVYENLLKKYLSTEAQEIVNKNPDLAFHFIYATFNGSGWFQKFAKKINDAVKNGMTDPSELTKIAMDSRKNSGNSLIAKSGSKMSQILNVA